MDVATLAEAVIEKGAPFIGSILGSPLAGMAISVLIHEFGVSKKFDFDELLKQINANPEKLKDIENRHQEAMLSIMSDFLEKTESNLPHWLIAIIGLLCTLSMIVYFVIDAWNNYGS